MNMKKKMKVTNIELVMGIAPALGKLAKLKFPKVETTLAIARNIKIVQGELDIYEDVRTKIAISEADKKENGDPVIAEGNYVFSDPEAQVRAQQKINEFNMTETDVELYPIDLNDLAEGEGVTPEMINGVFSISTDS
jgi:hypothetical protein